MQPPVVMAFRKRLKSFGYTGIVIVKSKKTSGEYAVVAVEPLARKVVRAKYSLTEMYKAFK